MRRRNASALVAAALSLACGSNAPEVPKELLASDSGCAAPDYPREGLGSETGSVVANAYPAGTKGVSLLLINTSAIWCMACVDEHRTLPEHQSELGPQGLVILSTLFQDAKREPATLEDVERWIDNFDTNFPMVADPDIQLERYASSDLAPLNMVVDPRSMRILRKYVGNQGTLWPYIESELKARSATP
jgi:hypothetical protein